MNNIPSSQENSSALLTRRIILNNENYFIDFPRILQVHFVFAWHFHMSNNNRITELIIYQNNFFMLKKMF